MFTGIMKLNCGRPIRTEPKQKEQIERFKEPTLEEYSTFISKFTMGSLCKLVCRVEDLFIKVKNLEDRINQRR